MSFEAPKGASILILISFFPLDMDRGWILFFGVILHFSFLFTGFGPVDIFLTESFPSFFFSFFSL